MFKKAGNGATLSLWSVSANDATPSLDPFQPAPRAATGIVSVPISNGADGDAIAPQFSCARAGR